MYCNKCNKCDAIYLKKSNFTAFNLKLSYDSVQGIFFEYAFSYDFKKSRVPLK